MSTLTTPPSPPDDDSLAAPPVATAPADAELVTTGPGRTVIPLLRRLHFYAGILVAPFLFLLALTGLLYVFVPQLNAVAYADILTVSSTDGPRASLADQVRAAQAAVPQGAVATVAPQQDADATTRITFTVPGNELQRTVFVDPYTTKVTGQLDTSFGESPLAQWLRGWHSNLHLGEPGRAYSELAASWLWVMVLGGLVLWFHRQRTARRRVRALALPDLGARKGVRRTRGWHASTGLWMALGLLFLSATGLTWSKYAGANFTAVLEGMHANAPRLDTALAGGEHAGHTGGGAMPTTVDIGQVDEVLRIARANGVDGPVDIGVPAKPGLAWSVTQTDNTFPIRLDGFAIDPAAGKVTATNPWSDRPNMSKLSSLGIQAHMGRLFGFANQVLLAALAIGLMCTIGWAYRMWWQRRPTRADRRAPVGAPPIRGGWRQVHVFWLVVGLGATVAVGYAMPYLGVTLLVFLALDLVAGAVQRRRARRAPAGSAVG